MKTKTTFDKNSTFEQMWEAIAGSKKISIVSHIMPDGDAIGSSVAMKEIIVKNTSMKKSDVKIAYAEAPRFLKWLDQSENITEKFWGNSQTLVLDTSTISRFADSRVVPEQTLKVDHHPFENKWKMEIGGDNWIATSLLIYELAKALNLKLTKKAREALWVAIWTDSDDLTALKEFPSNVFSTLNELKVNKRKLLKKLALNKEERLQVQKLSKEVKATDNLGYIFSEETISNDYGRQAIASIGNKTNKDVFAMFYPSSDKSVYICGLRSNKGVDVGTIATKLGGGGHYFASGFVKKTKEEALASWEQLKIMTKK